MLLCELWEFSCAFSVPHTNTHSCPALQIHFNASTVSQLMCFHSRCPFYLSFPPTAEWWLWPFFLMHHVCSIHCSLSAWYSFKRPKLITLVQPLRPRVQLLSMKQLLNSLPFTPVLKKWKRKKPQHCLSPICDYFGRWTVHRIPLQHALCLPVLILSLLQWIGDGFHNPG